MKKDIFYDGTVYTGSAGLALYYMINSLKKNQICIDTLQVCFYFRNHVNNNSIIFEIMNLVLLFTEVIDLCGY